MPGLGIIWAGLRLIGALLGLPALLERIRALRQARIDGARDQRLANAEEQLEQANDANANAEAVARLSDDQLDAELRADSRAPRE